MISTFILTELFLQYDKIIVYKRSIGSFLKPYIKITLSTAHPYDIMVINEQ